jgi:hypothetical protein
MCANEDILCHLLSQLTLCGLLSYGYVCTWCCVSFKDLIWSFLCNLTDQSFDQAKCVVSGIVFVNSNWQCFLMKDTVMV